MILQEEKLVKELLSNFIQEMNEWEKYCNEVEDSKDEFFLQKKAVEKIFDKYCTKKERKFGRPTTISYGFDGVYEYDLVEEKIKNFKHESSTRIIIETERNKPIKKKQIYVFLKKREDWLIDSKKRYSLNKEKWENISL